MILLAVILFWLCVIGYVPFHFRKTGVAKDITRGFMAFWYVIWYACEPEPEDCNEVFKSGVFIGLCSMGLVGLIILCTAIYTLWLAYQCS